MFNAETFKGKRASFDWTKSRLIDLELLLDLIQEARSINSHTGIIERLESMQKIANRLSRHMEMKNLSLIHALQCLMEDVEEQGGGTK